MESEFTWRKELVNLGFHFMQLRVFNFSGGVENHGLLDGEQTIGANEAVHRESSAFEVGKDERNGITIGPLFPGNLAKHQIVTRKISHNERGTAFAGLKVGLWKRKNDHLADSRLAHAASSSGVFQSLASADSLKSRPLKDSSSFLCRKQRAKS